MSLSRIIKFQENSGGDLEEFNFQQIGADIVVASLPAESGQFVPTMSIAPSDELDGFIPIRYSDPAAVAPPQPEPEVVEEPEPFRIALTEEELESKLSESFESGLQDGKKLAERGLLNVFNSLRAASEGLHSMRERVLRESEDELLKLVMLVARKVILQEVAQDNSILMSVIQAAVAKISERDEIVIHLNPDDYIFVTSHRADYFREELMTERVRFKPDPVLLAGCCQVDTEMGMIDASFDAQLEEIYRHMLEERSTSPEVGV